MKIRARAIDGLDQLHGIQARPDDLVYFLQQVIAVIPRQIPAHSAGNYTCAMHPFAAGDPDNFLAIPAQGYTLSGDIREIRRETRDVALSHIRIKTEQQIRRREMKKMQGMRLQYLPHVHEAAKLVSSGRRRSPD